MKKIVLLFLTVVLGTTMTFAAPPFYSITGGTSNNSFPLNTTGSNKVQWIYGPGEFSSAGGGVGTAAYIGLIDTLWLRVNTPTANFTSGFEVALGQNVGTQTTWTNTTYTTGLTIIQGPSAYSFATQAVNGGSASPQTGTWIGIPLTTPYLYNPALSLVVQMRQSGYSPGTTIPQYSSNGTRRIWGPYAATSGSGSGSGQANIGMSLASPLSCATPTLGSATFISQDSVTLAWTENNTPTAATTWEIEWGPSGFTPTGNPQITTTTNPHGMGGLTQNTAYDFHVRAYCGPNDSSYYHPITNVTTLATCPWPTALSASGVTASQATLDWTENGSATTWGIEIGLAGFTPTGNATFQTTSKPFTLPGLPSNTCFEYYVQADCGTDSSVFTGPFQFCTLIAPLSCPGTSASSVIWQESFDNTFTGQTNLPNAAAPGWTGNTISGNPTWALESNNTGSASTGPLVGAPGGGNNGYMYLEVSCVSGGNDTIKSPSIDLSGVVGAARVKWFNHMYGPNSGKLEVFVDNGTALTSIYVDSGQTQASSAAAWDSVVINLNSFIGGPITLVFVGTAANPGGCSGDRGVDEISVEACIACAAPASLAASNITSTQADISWTQNGSPVDWHLEVVPAGTTPTGVPTDTAATNPYTLTGLTLLQPVDVYVRANCGGTSGTSSWAGPLYILPCSPLAGNYTIDTSIAASATNFQSFTDAATALQCGVSAPVVFTAAAGMNWNEQFVIPEVMGASAVNTITFDGNGDTLSFAATVSADRHTIRLEGADYIHFENLTVRSTGGSFGFAMHLLNTSNGTNHNSFKNCTFSVPLTSTSSAFCPFAMSGSLTSATTSMGAEADSNTIDSCSIIGGYYGLTMYGVTSGLSNGNKVLNSSIEDFYAYGFYQLYQNELQVIGNEFSRPTRTSFTTFYGCYASGLGSNNLYEKNHFHDPCAAAPTSTASAYPIYFFIDATDTANSNIVQNNLIESINCGGTQYAIYTSTANNLKIYHNTVSLASTNSATGISRGIVQFGTSASGQDIRNNIVNVTRNSTGQKFGIYKQSASAICDYNDVYVTGSNAFYGYNGSNQATLANWQASTPTVGQNSKDENPIFASPATLDYRPANSNMDSLGTPLGVAFDFVDSARDASFPDAGAFEFAVNCQTPSALTATNVTSTSCDLSWVENGVATMWDIEIVPAGTTPTGIPDSVGVTNNTNFAITGLVQYQAVDFYVRAACGGSNGNSAYFGPLTVLPCAPLAGNYTIDSTLPVSATNFQSFEQVGVALGCGISAPVVFSVDNTLNNEQIVFNEVTGASAVNTITFNGNGNTIAFAPTISGERHTIRLAGADYFRFNDLDILSLGTSFGFAVHLFNSGNGTNHNHFTNCLFEVPVTSTSSAFVPFAMSGSLTSATSSCQAEADSNIVDSCTNIGGYYGMTMYGQTTGTHNGNQIKNTSIQDFYFYGFYQLYQNDMLVSGNDVSRPARPTISSGYGFYASGLGSNNVYEKNRIHDMFATNLTSTSTFYGFYFFIDASSAANSNIIRNNLVDNNQGNGTHYSCYFSTANNLKVYHNTFLENYAASTAGTTRVIYQAGTSAQNQDIQNNNVVLARGGTGTRYGIYVQANATNLTCDYNNVWIDTPSTATNYYGYNGGNRLDLTAWQASPVTVGANSLDVNPLFVNAAPDYSPSNPAMNGFGNALGVTDDFFSGPRSTTNPDMGAFEFSVSGTDMTLNAILSPVPSVGCYTNAETVTLEISNSGTDTINFVTNPVSCTTSVVTPGGPVSLIGFVNTGTLPPFATLSVPLAPTIDMTASGAYTIDAYISTTGDTVYVNDTIPTVNYNVNLSAGTISANPDIHCLSGISTISLTGSVGGSIQWQESSSATGPWTNVGAGGTSYTTGTLTATTYYRAYSVCNTNSDTTGVDTVIVENPMIASTMGDTICGPNSANLSASLVPNSGSVINWYDVATGGTKIDTGMNFTTPVLTATDTFYAEASAGAGAGDSVQLSNSSQYTGTTRGYHFISPIDFTITKLFVPTTYSTAAMNIAVLKFPTTPPTFSASTTSYQVLYSTFGNTSTGWIPVNIPIFAGDTIGILGDRATNSVNQYSSDQNITVDGNVIPIFRLIYQGDLGTAASSMPVPVSDNGTGSKGSVDFEYSIGCAANSRTPVVAVVNPSSGDLALATTSNVSSNTGNDSINDNQADGQTLSYYNPSCNLIATVNDDPGGNVLGMVTSTVNVEATVQTHNGEPWSRRWYQITPASNGPAEVTLYFTQADFDDYNAHPTVVASIHDSLPTGPTDVAGIARVRITKNDNGGLGVNPIDINPTSVVWDAANSRWAVEIIATSFSQFRVHALNAVNAPLPVSLTKFTVTKEGSVSFAAWITESEQNNSHFNLQRSLDGNVFTTLGKVNTKAVNGNSSTELNYNFTDNAPQIGHNYYRLEQVDQDGNLSYSKIIDVVWGADGSVVSIYPNPATDKLNVDVSIDKVAQLEVRLLDMSGRVVTSVMQQTQKGMNNVTLDLSEIASGVYSVQILENNALIHTTKVNKQVK